MGRPKTFERDEALDAAIGVFREHGFEGSSSAMLVQAMGIGRQSLYDTFGDKWALYREAVDRYSRGECGQHLAALRKGARAIDGLAAMIDRVVAEAATPCLGVGSICEFGRAREDLTALHEDAGQLLTRAITDAVRKGQEEGDVSDAVDAATAADFLVANIGGIRIAARGGAGPSQLRALGELALRALR